MTILRTLDRAALLGPGDHVPWAYADLTAFRPACVDFFAEGARRGERLMYAGDRPRGVLVDDLAGLPGRDTMLEGGGLTVHTVDELYLATRPFDARALVETFRHSAEAALTDGYSGLRVVGDLTLLVLDPDLTDVMVEYELAADAMYAATAATALCAVDRTRVGDRWRRVSVLHRIRHASGEEPMFALTLSRQDVRLIGEVDIACTDDLDELLRFLGASTAGPLSVTLVDLDFIDAAGTRVLARFQRAMASAGRAVRFRQLSAAARRTFAAFALEEETS